MARSREKTQNLLGTDCDPPSAREAAQEHRLSILLYCRGRDSGVRTDSYDLPAGCPALQYGHQYRAKMVVIVRDRHSCGSDVRIDRSPSWRLCMQGCRNSRPLGQIRMCPGSMSRSHRNGLAPGDEVDFNGTQADIGQIASRSGSVPKMADEISSNIRTEFSRTAFSAGKFGKAWRQPGWRQILRCPETTGLAKAFIHPADTRE